ncbi:GPW/gp25 family protein [Actinocrispum sp. NPDC049592]|uniref:GPW/gp25 family protein n=1 Tax=Actinocrispum sp. NPDC049592 TaxID=3154835 RepID=UPI003421BDCF
MAADSTVDFGRGIAHPLTISRGGGVLEAADLDKIEQSIRIILGTQHGERAMRPTFGANLASLAFAPNNAATANLARHYVESSLWRWEPRVEVLSVVVGNDVDGGALMITIDYRIKGTHQRQTLVFPFALEPPS